MSHDPNARLKKQHQRLVQRNKRYARWQSNWLVLVVGFLVLYSGLPFVAPTLMKLGATGPASVLYTLYSPMCHQFAFRSMFLYGEQTFYPRAAAEGDTFEPFDQRAAESPTFVALYENNRRGEIIESAGSEAGAAYQFGGREELATWNATLMTTARLFRGDEQMGYKVALCARDIAIYSTMAVGGVLFSFVRRRLRPVPLLLYVVLGLGPIGLDGFSQLLSYPPFELWPARESPMEIRMLTGALFGIMNVWLAFPYLERSFNESAQRIRDAVQQIER